MVVDTGSKEGAAKAGSKGGVARAAAGDTEPARAGLVLFSLIFVAAIANVNLSVANIALPYIGNAFDSSQTALDLISVGYMLGLAASVLYFGALGDRYGRKTMLVAGLGLSIPASLLAGFAPADWVVFGARVVGGLAAGMAYPTTLALITALWSGQPRTRAIALWSSLGGGIAAFGPLMAGALLEHFAWGSVFLVTVPLIAVSLVFAVLFVPAHVNETAAPVDHLGGMLSAITVGSLVLAINFLPVPHRGTMALVLGAVAIAAGVGFVVRQRRARNPLYDLHVAARRMFWVAAVGGIIVFGAQMAVMFVGQQYLQNVLGYSALGAGASIFPAIIFMIALVRPSAHLIATRGVRFTLLLGFVFVLLAFVGMLAFWGRGAPYWQIGLVYALLGAGLGLAGPPASYSLTGSVPVRRAGMASGTVDLQRDLGGALMTSIFGALLAAGYATSMSQQIAGAPDASQVTSSTQSQLELSFAGATSIAQHSPQFAAQIALAARTSFTEGDQWAFLAGIIAVLGAASLVFFLYPRREAEAKLRAAYAAEDDADAPPPQSVVPGRNRTAIH